MLYFLLCLLLAARRKVLAYDIKLEENLQNLAKILLILILTHLLIELHIFKKNSYKKISLINLMLKNIYNNLKSLNNSKYFAGLIMIMMNIGSKYITIKLSKTQEQYFKTSIARQILIFSIFWMATKDIFTSLILTAVFYVLTAHFFNENSKMCLLPARWKRVQNALDTNRDGKVSNEEIDKALKVLEKARRESFKSSLSRSY